MIANKIVLEWLKHRAGIKPIDDSFPKVIRKALDLNKEIDLSKSLGNRKIKAFVGFVDLVNFSEKTKGYTPDKVASYIKPFLENTIDILKENYCLIDKTIGDEVMFILPDMDDIEYPSIIFLGRIINALFSEIWSKGYTFRLGLSYGLLYIDQIKGRNFSEWSCFGETIHLAKRLHGVLNPEKGFVGAVGVLKREGEQKILEIIKSHCSVSWDNLNIEDGTPCKLKGISDFEYLLLKKEVNNA